jgi:hypothetical protein
MKSATNNRDFSRAAISRLVAERLKLRLGGENLSGESPEHLDDDSMAAFVEGHLEDAQARPIISHLVNCASCLHLTAQLIRYEAETEEVSGAGLPDESAGPLRRFFDRLASGAVPSLGEDVVFAYNEKENRSKEEAEPDADKPKPSE